MGVCLNGCVTWWCGNQDMRPLRDHYETSRLGGELSVGIATILLSQLRGERSLGERRRTPDKAMSGVR